MRKNIELVQSVANQVLKIVSVLLEVVSHHIIVILIMVVIVACLVGIGVVLHVQEEKMNALHFLLATAHQQ